MIYRQDTMSGISPTRQLLQRIGGGDTRSRQMGKIGVRETQKQGLATEDRFLNYWRFWNPYVFPQKKSTGA